MLYGQVRPGSIAQCYVATITAFIFCVIQTKWMPYAEPKDNYLKQLAEVQLLMTLLVSIILRTDLSAEDLGRAGYDTILLGVNVVMVPGFLCVAGLWGLYELLKKVKEFVRKKRLIKQKMETAKTGTDENMIKKAQERKQAEANRRARQAAQRERQKKMVELKKKETSDKEREADKLTVVMSDLEDKMRETTALVGRVDSYVAASYDKARVDAVVAARNEAAAVALQLEAEEELRKLHVEHGKEQREHRFDVESMTEQQKKMQTALLVKQRELQNKVADLQAAEKNLRAAHLAEQKKKTGTTSRLLPLLCQP